VRQEPRESTFPICDQELPFGRRSGRRDPAFAVGPNCLPRKFFEAKTSQEEHFTAGAGMQSNAPLENTVLKTAMTFSNPESEPSAQSFGRALLFIGTWKGLRSFRFLSDGQIWVRAGRPGLRDFQTRRIHAQVPFRLTRHRDNRRTRDHDSQLPRQGGPDNKCESDCSSFSR
jgi:hypothetical protein